MVGVVVAGCVVLPGDGGHGSLPGDCLLFHVCCVSYLEHCIIQLDGEKSKFSYSHFGYPFTLYVLLYKITVPAQYIFDRENVRYMCEIVSRLQYVAIWYIAFYLDTVGFYSALAP